jgi:hypothetical protein
MVRYDTVAGWWRTQNIRQGWIDASHMDVSPSTLPNLFRFRGLNFLVLII